MKENIYKEYIEILREELVPAMGCTEPVSYTHLQPAEEKQVMQVQIQDQEKKILN